MKRLDVLFILMFCILSVHAQVSKISEEVAMGDQQYLMGNIDGAQKAYKRAIKSKKISATLLGHYRTLELSTITGSETKRNYTLGFTKASIQQCLRKMGTPNMTKEEFYAQNNIQPLHQMSLQTNNAQGVSQQANVVLSQTNNQPIVKI